MKPRTATHPASRAASPSAREPQGGDPQPQHGQEERFPATITLVSCARIWVSRVFCKLLHVVVPLLSVISRWREIRACNDNACGEPKGQNSHDGLLDLTCLLAATDPKAPIYRHLISRQRLFRAGISTPRAGLVGHIWASAANGRYPE
jgi:hypothetical protein